MINLSRAGIITNAMNAKEKSKIASLLEDLEIMMMDFNMSNNTGSSELRQFMNKQVANGKIDSFKTKRNAETNAVQCIIEKDGYIFYAIPDGDYWKIATTDSDGSDVGGVNVQVYTDKNVNENKTFELGNAEKETDVVFYDPIEGELNFEIKEGVVNIYIYDDITLTNSGLGRSAIDIYPGAKLNLFLEEGCTMEVNSGFGKNADGALPGEGGFAGIHVPKGAIFNLYGEASTLIAKAGNASKAGYNNTSGIGGAGGGRSWCWNWAETVEKEETLLLEKENLVKKEKTVEK